MKRGASRRAKKVKPEASAEAVAPSVGAAAQPATVGIFPDDPLHKVLDAMEPEEKIALLTRWFPLKPK